MRFTVSHRSFDILELLVGYGLILAVIWTPGSEQRVLYWSAFAWIAVTAWLRRNQARPLGLGLRGLRPSLWIILAAVVLFLLGIGIADLVHSLHDLYGPLPVVEHVAEYSFWALMQQFILQVYVLLRLLRIGLRRAPAIAVAAVMFAVAHIPNPVLVPAVLIWAAICCWLYLRYRNLYPIAIAHGLLGMCIALCVPNSVNHHMRVGLGYLRYGHHQHPGLEITDR
ncbi:MAG TPA: CPBP family glutamic-type intramembrane protease [Acidobacteriaceae bacterium]|nr:CPBP family glutamic-type intramembrane protease [Acidobacteriaceae bacterium]